VSGIIVPFVKNEPITGVLICLDVNSETIEFASHNNINVMVSHHPVFLKDKNGKQNKDALEMIDKLKKNKIALLSYHTNVDNSQYGLSYHVAKEIGLSNIKAIGNSGIVTGSLRFPYRPRVLSAVLIKSFDLNKVMFNEDSQSKHLAICAGAGFDIFKQNITKLSKIDLFITGDVK
jgi:putative NIF3 family GTP cyclohydrolase 1 type 2